MGTLIQIVYFAAAVVFILGLKQMSSPVTARRGIIWAGIAMLVASVVTLFTPGMGNYVLMTLALVVGSVLAYWSGRKVAMTDMPQMIALYNGMGGGAAGAIAAIELVQGDRHHDTVTLALAVLGAFIGSVSFSGSLIAFGKLQGILQGGALFANQQATNALLGLITVGIGTYLVFAPDAGFLVLLFFVGALVFGVLVTTPIGGADMPVVISLYNACTGLAVAFEGFVLQNPAMIIAGTVVGAAGTLLTQMMAKAMNRSLANVLFSGLGTGEAVAGEGPSGSMRSVEANDAAVTMAYASKVIIVPGYGMAVAQAQHKIWEMSQLLIERGVEVKFAIHPVAGRMPGHMNVLLAEAGVPYDLIHDLEEINAEFPQADVALVIGANDVVNPDARSNKSSPIYGMPILDVDKAKNVIVIKRGKGTGFSGVENVLFFLENCSMLYGDGQKVGGALVASIKALDA